MCIEVSMKRTFFFLLYCDAYLSKMASWTRKKKCRAGLDFIHWELIGSLDCQCTGCPRAEKHINEETKCCCKREWKYFFFLN